MKKANKLRAPLALTIAPIISRSPLKESKMQRKEDTKAQMHQINQDLALQNFEKVVLQESKNDSLHQV
jgi:hypothetical protein